MAPEKEKTNMMQSAAFTVRDTNMAKGIAISILMIHHCFMQAGRFKGFQMVFWPFSQSRLIKIAVYCKICVPIFAFLSAYGMTLALMKIKDRYPGQAFKLTLRRLVRLYGGYWFAYAVCFTASCFLSPERLDGLKGGGSFAVNILIDLLGFGTLHQDRTLLGTFWYVGLAVMQILLMPFLYRLSEKVHPMLLILLMVLASRVTHLQGANGNYNYLLLTAAGILTAKADLWRKARLLGEETGGPGAYAAKAGKALLAVILLLASYKIFYFGFHTIDQDISMTLCAMIVVFSVAVLWSRIPLLSGLLAFAGFYSMNVYYIHNFYRINWLHDFLFSLKYWWATAGMLLAVSLASAVVMELVKKHIGYTGAVNRLSEKIAHK